MARKEIKEKEVNIIPKEENKMKEKELFEDTAPEMELELDGEEITAEMEEVVSEKVKQEEIKNQEQKRKPGPKPKSEAEKAAKKEEKAKEKKEVKLNLKDLNVIQREIKKGRLSAPCYRIEKVEGSPITYDLLESKGVIFSTDAKYEKYDNVSKMTEGKVLVTIRASKQLGMEKFKAKHKTGEEVEHDYVRVELHKPGRAKDVVELYTVREMKSKAKEIEAINKKKEEEAKKKAEKEAAEKKVEKENKEASA